MGPSSCCGRHLHSHKLASSCIQLILPGTGAAAQEISNDYSKADFAHFKTYAWASGHSVADESLNQSIVSSIDGPTSAKGLTKVSPGEDPNVVVSYDVVFDRDIRSMGFRNGLRNLRWRSGSVLVVTLVDSGTRVMVWRGMASGKVDANASPEKHDKKIHEVVQKIFLSDSLPFVRQPSAAGLL